MINIIILVLASGFFAAGVGLIFGLPSLRIKGLYLAVTTLAAQFFLSGVYPRRVAVQLRPIGCNYRPRHYVLWCDYRRACVRTPW